MKMLKTQITRRKTSIFLAMLIGTGVALYSMQAGAAITPSCTSTDVDCLPEDIINTKHNFAMNDDIQSKGTTEICVFCHTPHGGNSDLWQGAPAASAPLWNRLLPTASKYEDYSSPNFDSGTAASTGPKGVSLACLSCHDGSIAIDALINSPGSGGYIAGNKGDGELGTNAFGDGGFTGPFVDADGRLNGTGVSLEAPTGRPVSPFPNLGVNLKDDHPIGIPIPAPTLDPQFSEIYNGDRTDIGTGTAGTNVWFVLRNKAAAPADYDKRDKVRLYPSTGGATAADMYVECASCHNPHTPRPVFLRRPQSADGSLNPAGDPNKQSALCLTCHQK